MPKLRRVVLTLEVETELPLEKLRKAGQLQLNVNLDDDEIAELDVKQAQANVIKAGS